VTEKLSSKIHIIWNNIDTDTALCSAISTASHPFIDDTCACFCHEKGPCLCGHKCTCR